jgi:hypothetical protein
MHTACSGLVLCYYEPLKHTDYPDQKAKGYLPLWMVSKLEADVSSARPHFTLEYGPAKFTFKGLHHSIIAAIALSDSPSLVLSQPASVSQIRRVIL